MISGQTFLLVEDDEADARYAQIQHNRFNEGGLHVVSDALEAMRYLEGTGEFKDRTLFPFPDALLLDLSLPGMSGLDFLALVRANVAECIKNLPVIITSVTQYSPDVLKARNLGVKGFLTKPIVWEHIQRLLTVPSIGRQPDEEPSGL
jgi:CheY-like chemotaxis protein